MVSFCAPQEVPARALRMLRWDEAWEIMSEMWGEKDFGGFLKVREFVIKEYLRMVFGFFGGGGKEGN